MNPVCFSMPDDSPFGTRLAEALGVPHGEVELHRFPDGETRVRLPRSCVGRSVVVVQSGREPDRRALPLHFAAHAARAMGAGSVGLVAPYLPYMRQDQQFREGEAVSAAAYARFLSGSFDWMATVDPHLHRIHALEEIFSIPASCVSSTPAIAKWVGAHVVDPVIVGPDAESGQWVRAVARALGTPWTTLEKHRAGDREVTVTLRDAAILQGRSPVIVDDIASSGRTLAEAAMALKSLGSLPVTCAVVHALLEPSAEAGLRAAGVARFVSTNTLRHATNAIDVVPLVAEHVRGLLDGRNGPP